MNIKEINGTALAYIGDAVYELKIRNYLITSGKIHGDVLHKSAIKYVSAPAQAKAIKQCLDVLSEEEVGVVRRARNRKINTKPANVSPMTYKWATALEALIGYLYLCGRHERVDELVFKFIEAIEGDFKR